MKNKLYILTAVTCLAFLVCMVLAAIVIAYPALGMSVPLISGAGLSLLLGFAGIAVMNIGKRESLNSSKSEFNFASNQDGVGGNKDDIDSDNTARSSSTGFVLGRGDN